MKANEAPERIWINSPQDLPCGIVDSNSVEYTRTDAFIEKAEVWLIKNQQGFILTDKDITDFVNYMKGENKCNVQTAVENLEK